MFSEKGGRECGREGRKKRRKSNYSGIIINSQLVPRNYSFEDTAGRGNERKKGGRKRQFRWKINHSFPSLFQEERYVLERTNNLTTNTSVSRAYVAVFLILRLFLAFFYYFCFSTPAIAVCGPHESFRKICQFEQNPIWWCARESTPELWKRANDEKEERNL